jgi:hypothetical protein
MQDQINPKDIQLLGGGPDVLSWPITGIISRLNLTPTNVEIEHNRSDWPDVRPPGWDGPIESTIYPVVRGADGQWRTAPTLEYWQGRINTGSPVRSLQADWTPLPVGQPNAGDELGFFVAAGDQRFKDVRTVNERTAIVLVRDVFQEFHFTDEGQPVTTPNPEPVPTQEPPAHTDPPAGVDYVTKAELDASEARIIARIDRFENNTKLVVAYAKPFFDFLTRWYGVGKGKDAPK